MAVTAAPPALTRVAQRFAATTRGIVGFRLHRVLDVHAGFSSRHEDLVLNGVFKNGSIVKVRVVSYTIDGRQADAATTDAMARAFDRPQPGSAFAPPFDARNAAAYSYGAYGNGTMAFSSAVRDAGHGNGTFTYRPDGTVLAITYQPNALPPHATWGQITDRRAQVLPNYWATVGETQQYKGRYGPFAGAASEEVDFSDFRRFADLGSALASL
ncbi:MAG TPA: hypothetical protein VGX91_01350 [Candidatus Cybelea sp.]|jgi:hypothetical protein|nr:hypothetical protein [Candidatus Cybelea sp.]